MAKTAIKPADAKAGLRIDSPDATANKPDRGRIRARLQGRASTSRRGPVVTTMDVCAKASAAAQGALDVVVPEEDAKKFTVGFGIGPDEPR